MEDCVSVQNHRLSRKFCKTEWTKPMHVDKPHTERRTDLPLVVQNSPERETVRYGELWKAWFTIEHELSTAFAKNANFFTTRISGDPNNKGSGKANKNIDQQCYISSEEEFKRRLQVDAILRTYSELQAFTSPTVKKSGFAIIEEKGPVETLEEAKLNATTKDIEEEKLTQKLETIEEVPLVEADPDIIKPPKTSGPAVMSISYPHDPEEFAKHSDFQIAEDPESNYAFIHCQVPLPEHDNGKVETTEDNAAPESNSAFIHCQEPLAEHDNKEETAEDSAAPNLIKNYFQKRDLNKPNFNDVITLNAVPEINAEEDISLTELMQRVRHRNRLLRCRDINHQLSCVSTKTDMDTRTNFPRHQNTPTSPPGWGYPGQHQPQRHQSPSYYPNIANPAGPQKAEPITPDSRPGYHRATKVNPVALALYLGPLVTAIRNATVLFPLLVAFLMPKIFAKNLANTKTKEIPNIWCVLHSKYESESEKEEVLAQADEINIYYQYSGSNT